VLLRSAATTHSLGAESNIPTSQPEKISVQLIDDMVVCRSPASSLQRSNVWASVGSGSMAMSLSTALTCSSAQFDTQQGPQCLASSV
jgi:hypothetical protein